MQPVHQGLPRDSKGKSVGPARRQRPRRQIGTYYLAGVLSSHLPASCWRWHANGWELAWGWRDVVGATARRRQRQPTGAESAPSRETQVGASSGAGGARSCWRGGRQARAQGKDIMEEAAPHREADTAWQTSERHSSLRSRSRTTCRTRTRASASASA